MRMVCHMPREVDTDQRLADIAAATLSVARETGAPSVTIRSVARRLGGSTTLVPNYLPTRAALIMTALDRGRDRWLEERDATIAAHPPADRLAALMEWSLSSTAEDAVLRTLILEIVANAEVEPELRETLQLESAEFRGFVERTADSSGFADPVHVAELLYVIVRGCYLAMMEDDRHWTPERIRSLTDTVIGSFERA